MLTDAITTRIAAAKRRLEDGGILHPVEWGVPGERDIRGRRTFTYTTISAMIEQRPALDRDQFNTERTDDTVLVVLDPLAIKTEHTFRWGNPPHVYSIQSVDGIVQDETTGVRFSSEIVVIR